MDIFTIAIQKGGTGKTTTAAALTQAAAHMGRKVLAIDLDPQGNLSFALAAQTAPETGNSYNLLMGLPPEQLIQTTAQGIDVIPAAWDLAAISSGRGSARRLQRALEPIKERYDMIIIDTPPTAGELQYNALQAATGVIIPLQADVFNIQSLYQITDTVKQIQTSNPGLSIAGIIVTQFDGRSTLSKQLKKTIIDNGYAVGARYLGTIRAGIAVKEAAALQRSLYDYAPKSKPAADYMNILFQLSK